MSQASGIYTKAWHSQLERSRHRVIRAELIGQSFQSAWSYAQLVTAPSD